MPNVNKPASIVQKTTGTTTTPTTGNTTPTTGTVTIEITKFQFRKLFTTAERIIIDNLATNPAYSDSVKSVVATLLEDIRVSNVVILTSADVVNGVNYLASVGIITTARAKQILANQPPA